MDKQILVYLYIRILLNNKKGQNADTFMDKSQKHYSEQKKKVRYKTQIPSGFIAVKF